jgi:hypothetical protein
MPCAGGRGSPRAVVQLAWHLHATQRTTAIEQEWRRSDAAVVITDSLHPPYLTPKHWAVTVGQTVSRTLSPPSCELPVPTRRCLLPGHGTCVLLLAEHVKHSTTGECQQLSAHSVLVTLTWVELPLAVSVWYERSEAAAADITMHQPPAGAADVVATLVYRGAGGQLLLQGRQCTSSRHTVRTVQPKAAMICCAHSQVKILPPC